MADRPNVHGSERQLRFVLDLVGRGKRVLRELADIEPEVRGRPVHEPLARHMTEWKAVLDAWEALAEGRTPDGSEARKAAVRLARRRRTREKPGDAEQAAEWGIDAGSAIDVLLALLEDAAGVLAQARAEAERGEEEETDEEREVRIVGSPSRIRLLHRAMDDLRETLDLIDHLRDRIAGTRWEARLRDPVAKARTVLAAWEHARRGSVPRDPTVRFVWGDMHTNPYRHRGHPRDAAEAAERGVQADSAFEIARTARSRFLLPLRSMAREGILDREPDWLAHR